MKNIFYIMTFLVGVLCFIGCDDKVEAPNIDGEYPRIFGSWPNRTEAGELGQFNVRKDSILYIPLQFTPSHLCTGIWYVDGVDVAEGTLFEQTFPNIGLYHLKLEVKTPDGSTTYREALINVTEESIGGDPDEEPQSDDIVLFDFDNVTPDGYDTWADMFITVDNPLPDATNGSAKVGKFVHTRQWSEAGIQTSIDSRFYTSFEFKIYIPEGTTPRETSVVMYGESGSVIDEFVTTIEETGKWVVVQHSYSLATKIAKVAVSFNRSFNENEIGATTHAFFDDFIFKKTTSSLVILYNETFSTPSEPWRDWTVTAQDMAGKWVGGHDLDFEGSISIIKDWDKVDSQVLQIDGTSPLITIPGISDLGGCKSYTLGFDLGWPFDEGLVDAFFASPAAEKTIDMKYKVDGGEWIDIENATISDIWDTHSVTIDQENISTIDIRIGIGSCLYKAQIDNIKIIGNLDE